MLKFNRKGQGALEYLMIIGGALLVAVIVITLILSINSGHTNQVKKTDEGYQSLVDSTIIQPIITNVDCNVHDNTATTKIWLNPSPTKGVTKYRIKINDLIYNTDVVLTNGYLERKSFDLGIDTENETYNISVAAVKGDSTSLYTTSFSCVAHT